MSNDKKKKMIEKVKKLLSLSDSPNEHEAILAARRAKDILDKYNLTMTEIDTPEINENVYDTGSIQIKNWLAFLANGVAKNFNSQIYMVKGIRKTNWNRNGKNAKLVFVGSELDLEIVNYVFGYLKKTVETMTDNYLKSLPNRTNINKKTLKNSYVLGLVSEINKKITEFAKKDDVSDEMSASGKTGKELIIIKKDAIGEFLKDKNLKSKKRNTSKVNGEAYNKGGADGKNVSINRGVYGSNGSAQKVIGR